jgi:hypothetical protein
MIATNIATAGLCILAAVCIGHKFGWEVGIAVFCVMAVLEPRK